MEWRGGGPTAKAELLKDGSRSVEGSKWEIVWVNRGAHRAYIERRNGQVGLVRNLIAKVSNERVRREGEFEAGAGDWLDVGGEVSIGVGYG